MPADARQWLLLCGYAAALLSLVYSALSAYATRKLRHRPRAAPDSTPAVSVLKPLCGALPESYECLRSFCEQAYPAFQLIFGLTDADDPAAAIVRRLRREYPALDIVLSIERRSHGSNRKVSNLINMLAHARHEYLIIADSDVRVERNYLAQLVPPLLDAAVGVVTCSYRGAPRPGIWSTLGALYINNWFLPSVCVAASLGYRAFAFGATIGIRRETLMKIGGFNAIVDQLADDYRLGELTRRLGLRTELSSVVVDTVVRERTAAELLFHELRWRRTIRNINPCGYAFSFVTLGSPVAGLPLLLSGGAAFAAAIFAASLILNGWVHCNVRRREESLRLLLLLPLRDVLHLVLWIWSFAGWRVQWRNDRFVLRRDGAAQPIGDLGR